MAVKRLNRKALVAHLHDKIENPVPGLDVLRSEVIRAIYSGLLEAVDRGEFDYPDQPMDPATGRFGHVPQG